MKSTRSKLLFLQTSLASNFFPKERHARAASHVSSTSCHYQQHMSLNTVFWTWNRTLTGRLMIRWPTLCYTYDDLEQAIGVGNILCCYRESYDLPSFFCFFFSYCSDVCILRCKSGQRGEPNAGLLSFLTWVISLLSYLIHFFITP